MMITENRAEGVLPNVVDRLQMKIDLLRLRGKDSVLSEVVSGPVIQAAGSHGRYMVQGLPDFIHPPEKILPNGFHPTIRQILTLLARGDTISDAVRHLRECRQIAWNVSNTKNYLNSARNIYDAFSTEDLLLKALKAGEIRLLDIASFYPWGTRGRITSGMRQALDMKIFHPGLTYAELGQLSKKKSLEGLSTDAMRKLKVHTLISAALMELCARVAGVDLTVAPDPKKPDDVMERLQQFEEQRGRGRFAWDEYIAKLIPSLPIDENSLQEIYEEKERVRLSLTDHIQDILVLAGQGYTHKQMTGLLETALSPHTIKNLLNKTFSKLHVDGVESAIFVALDKRLISLKRIIDGYDWSCIKNSLSRREAEILGYRITHPGVASRRVAVEFGMKLHDLFDNISSIISKLHARDGLHADMIGLAALCDGTDSTAAFPIDSPVLNSVSSLPANGTSDHKLTFVPEVPARTQPRSLVITVSSGKTAEMSPEPGVKLVNGKPKQGDDILKNILIPPDLQEAKPEIPPKSQEKRFDSLVEMLSSGAGIMRGILNPSRDKFLWTEILASAPSIGELSALLSKGGFEQSSGLVEDAKSQVSIYRKRITPIPTAGGSVNLMHIMIIDSSNGKLSQTVLPPIVRQAVLAELNKLKFPDGTPMLLPEHLMRRLKDTQGSSTSPSS